MKILKFKYLIDFGSFFGSLGGCTDLHVSVQENGKWTLPSRLTVPKQGQLTRLFPHTNSHQPLMVEFIWVAEPKSILCRDEGGNEIPNNYRFRCYQELAMRGVSLNTTPKEIWDLEAERRSDSFWVAKVPSDLATLVQEYQRVGLLEETEI